MINIQKIEVSISGSDHITNTYLVYDEARDALLIDPGDEAQKIINEIDKAQVNVKYICITHGHGDHIGALQELAKYTNATILVHEFDLVALLNKRENYSQMLGVKRQNISQKQIVTVTDGYKFSLGKLEFEVIHTPGHTAGGICIYELHSNTLFTGDTIFADCYGRCDLESASFDDMVKSLRKIFDRFSDITIYPGHDNVVNIDSAKRKIKMLVALKGERI